MKKNYFPICIAEKTSNANIWALFSYWQRKNCYKDTFSLVAEKQTKIDKFELTIYFSKFYCKTGIESLQNPFKSSQLKICYENQTDVQYKLSRQVMLVWI